MSKSGVLSSKSAEQYKPVGLAERGAPMQPETSVQCSTGGTGGAAWVDQKLRVVRQSNGNSRSRVVWAPSGAPAGGLGSHAFGAAAAKPGLT